MKVMDNIAKAIICMALLAAFPWYRAGAQMITQDPVHIATSIMNASQAMDASMDQLGTLLQMTDEMKGVRDALNFFLDDDSAFGKAVGILEDLGQLERVGRMYIDLTDRMVDYSESLATMGRFNLGDVTDYANFLSIYLRQLNYTVDFLKQVSSKAGLTKGDKLRMADETVREIRKIGDEMDSYYRAVFARYEQMARAKALGELDRTLSSQLTPDSYVASLEGYGSRAGAASVIVNIVSIILGMSGLILLLSGYARYAGGYGPGSRVNSQVFIKIGAGLFACTVILQVLVEVFKI